MNDIDREALKAVLALVLKQQATLSAVRKLADAAFAGDVYTLPGGYPSRPVEARDIRRALDES